MRYMPLSFSRTTGLRDVDRRWQFYSRCSLATGNPDFYSAPEMEDLSRCRTSCGGISTESSRAVSSRRPVLTHSGVSASVGCGRIAHREAWSAFGWVMRTGERAIYLALELDRSWTEMTGVHERRVVDAPFC